MRWGGCQRGGSRERRQVYLRLIHAARQKPKQYCEQSSSKQKSVKIKAEKKKKNVARDFPGSPVAKALPPQSLVSELRSHMPRSQKKQNMKAKKINKTEAIL